MKHFFQKIFLGEVSTHIIQLPKAEQGNSLLCLAVLPSLLLSQEEPSVAFYETLCMKEHNS